MFDGAASRMVVGHKNATWWPEATTHMVARMDTSVFPKPTSPMSSCPFVFQSEIAKNLFDGIFRSRFFIGKPISPVIWGRSVLYACPVEQPFGRRIRMSWCAIGEPYFWPWPFVCQDFPPVCRFWALCFPQIDIDRVDPCDWAEREPWLRFDIRFDALYGVSINEHTGHQKSTDPGNGQHGLRFSGRYRTECCLFQVFRLLVMGVKEVVGTQDDAGGWCRHILPAGFLWCAVALGANLFVCCISEGRSRRMLDFSELMVDGWPRRCPNLGQAIRWAGL